MKSLRRKTKKDEPVEAAVEEVTEEMPQEESAQDKKKTKNRGPQQNRGPQGKSQKAKTDGYAGAKSIGRRTKV